MTLISMGICPYCGNGANTACFATYDDGYKCFSCGKCKKLCNNFITSSDKNSELYSELSNEIFRISQPLGIDNKAELYKLYFNDELIYKHNIKEDDKGAIIINTPKGYWRKHFKLGIKQHKGEKMSEIFGKEGIRIVIVEDRLSACRLGEITTVCCLHGLFLANITAKEIVRQYNEIIVWLDKDERGQSAAYKIIGVLNHFIKDFERKNTLARINKVVRSVASDLDPKYYSEAELKEYLTGGVL